MRNVAENDTINELFTQLYNEHRKAVYKLCLARLSYDERSAEDCMQNAFLVLYKKLSSGEEIVYPKAFLYKTANKFVLKNIYEKQKYNKRYAPLEDYKSQGVDEQYEIDSKLDYDLLEKQISSCLNKSELELLKLKYIDDYTIEQTAEILNISKTAAAKRLQRLREKIKRNIKLKERSCD